MAPFVTTPVAALPRGARRTSALSLTFCRFERDMRDALLDDLDARQREAVTSTAAPLAVLAPAGSGKTRVLTRRIAWRVREETADAKHVLGVTFTRNAATELTHRLRALGVGATVTAGTFHALALAQLRRRAAEQRREPPTVLGSKTRLLTPLLKGRAGRTLSAADLAAEIEWAKAAMHRPADYAAAARAAGRRLPAAAEEIADLYQRYEHAKQAKRACDFDDLLWWCADAIERDATFAAAQHWRFRHLFVDEFQDATPLQVRLLRAWLGDRPDLFVVGDVAQSIYGFAGADAASLASFSTHFPGGVTIALDHNYRSTPQIVAVSEVPLGAAAGVERAPTVAVRPEGTAPVLHAYDDDDGEAMAVADACWSAFTRGMSWRDMAVLFRTNAQSSAFERALTRRGIPFRVVGAGRFTERPAVRVLLDALRASEREARARPFTDHLADLAADETLGRADGDAPTVSDDELRAHRDPLLALGREYLAADGGPGTLAGFIAWLELATRSDADGEGVALLTFHRAKGLEWRVVFVTGLEAGLVPISAANTAAARAEEQRLLHVALGRAGDELHCSWAMLRTVGGRLAKREPSTWCSPLEACSAASTGRPVDARSALAGARAALDAAQPPQPVPRALRRRR
jgi:DNA helicase-2/ATP-dependent DNA helicase PcrA